MNDAHDPPLTRFLDPAAESRALLTRFISVLGLRPPSLPPLPADEVTNEPKIIKSEPVEIKQEVKEEATRLKKKSMKKQPLHSQQVLRFLKALTLNKQLRSLQPLMLAHFQKKLSQTLQLQCKTLQQKLRKHSKKKLTFTAKASMTMCQLARKLT